MSEVNFELYCVCRWKWIGYKNELSKIVLPQLSSSSENVNTIKVTSEYTLTKNSYYWNCFVVWKNYCNMGANQSFVCGQCGETFQTLLDKQQHRQQKHQRILPCRQCGKEFSTLYDRQVHMELAHPRIFTCSHAQCAEGFTSEDGLQDHVEHAHPKIFNCFVCEEIMDSLSDLESHMVREHPRPYGCFRCEETFVTADVREQHMEHVHRRENR